jgi:hypothetical protein
MEYERNEHSDTMVASSAVFGMSIPEDSCWHVLDRVLSTVFHSVLAAGAMTYNENGLVTITLRDYLDVGFTAGVHDQLYSPKNQNKRRQLTQWTKATTVMIPRY